MKKSKNLDWVLFFAVTSLLMWHNGHTTYYRVSQNFHWFVAVAEAIITVIVIEATSGYFLHAQYDETTRARRAIAVVGVVIPLIISGVINLNISVQVADWASRIATIACACIVAAWHWYKPREDIASNLMIKIKQLTDQLAGLEATNTQLTAQLTANTNAASDLLTLADEVERLTLTINGLTDDLTAERNARFAAERKAFDLDNRLTEAKSLALASANTSVNVTVNTNAQPVSDSVNVHPINDSAQLALTPPTTRGKVTDEAIKEAIDSLVARNEQVTSAKVADIFGVTAANIRQKQAWKEWNQQSV